MDLAELTSFPLHFALVFFRIGGLMIFAPLIGSQRIPARVKLYFASVLALITAPTVDHVAIPDSLWTLAVGIGAEILFGLMVGMILSMTFIAAQWAGGVAGQQMGFNMAGAFSPGMDLGGDPISDIYFILALIVFLLLDGHHQMMLGLRSSFDHLPPLSVTLDAELLATFSGAFAGAMSLAMRIAAPTFVAMLAVDLALGMVGKTIPQMNLMSVGLSVRAMVGLTVCIFGLGLIGLVLAEAIGDALTLAEQIWTTPRP